jgi:alanine-glyoxylate transaminase/serine-glyoxylate transaminase/serine-pyruvate transaminase
VLDGIKPIFQTTDPVVIYPASGTGAWEAALVNTLSPGDRVLMAETGQFASLWHALAERLGLDVVFLRGDWRHGVRAEEIAQALEQDKNSRIKAVCCVHNETSTGITSDIAAVRKAMDDAGHPALLMVDTISSLASIDYRHDEWGVDVTIGGSQKGLMLPPGLGFNAVGAKALAASDTAAMTRSYWDWGPMLTANKGGAFPYTPATNLLYGLDEALTMLGEEGLVNVFHRHARLAEAARLAVAAWGLETVAQNEGEMSNSLTAVMLPDGHNADDFRATVLERFNMSLGNGLGRLAGKVFRIGHLGDFNELMLAGTLSGVEMGLAAANIPHNRGGVQAALDYLSPN